MNSCQNKSSIVTLSKREGMNTPVRPSSDAVLRMSRIECKSCEESFVLRRLNRALITAEVSCKTIKPRFPQIPTRDV